MHSAVWHAGKVVLFYLLRAALGLLSAFTETLLVRSAASFPSETPSPEQGHGLAWGLCQHVALCSFLVSF